MEAYLEKIKPKVSDIWRADELYVKIKGDMKYLFAIMDDETRYWIAQEVAESKYKHDARKLFQLAKKVTGKKPETLITDGLPAYHKAYVKEFWTARKPRTEHIVEKLLQEVKNFTTLLKHDPEGAKRSVFQLLSTYVFKLSLKKSLNNALLWFIVSRTSPL